MKLHHRADRTARALSGLMFVALMLSASPSSAATSSDPGDAALAAWARENLQRLSVDPTGPPSDLESLRRLIGGADVVSFGEGRHGAAEPLTFRNRLFRFLVEEMDFTAIAIESGIVESYVINDYVLGGPGDAASVATQGITSGLNAFPQQAELVQWMRDYNADPKHKRKIEFYGMDVSVSPVESESALEHALRYLDQVEPSAATALRDRVRRMRPLLKIDRSSDAPGQYSQLPQAQRDEVTATIADMLTLFKLRAGAYIAATSDRTYQLAYRSAVAAEQSDEYLRQIPIGWTPKQAVQSSLGTVAVADRAKEDNIEWIMQQQGPRAKLLIFAHLGHVATAPVFVRLPDVVPLPPLVGTYLKRQYGSRLVTIGHFFALDGASCKDALPPAQPTSIEGVFAALKIPAFTLDLRAAPRDVAQRLQPVHDLYGTRPVHRLSVGEGVDAVLFTERVTPAVPCR